MKEMSSLHQFFSEINCQFQCYNIGRRISPIEQANFINFEQTLQPWKTPYLQQAWLGILFWNEQTSSEQHVWFLKLPLDEQAKLNLIARDDFLRSLVEVLGNTAQPSNDKLHSLENVMKDSPYGFQPKQEQLANFHAIVHQEKSLAPSSFYSKTQHYLLEPDNYVQWSQLGFQGFADISARLNETYENTSNKTNEQLIIQAIPFLPIEPYKVLCSCLENQKVSSEITQIVYERLEAEIIHNNSVESLISICIASIQASSQSADQSQKIELISSILKSSISSNIEILATLSGRCWEALSHLKIQALFLEALATADTLHPGAFKAVLSDLMFIPGMREGILNAFRAPERSPQLSQAIGQFFKSL